METIGQGAFTGATWYFALADAVALPLGLGDPLVFWRNNAELSPVERWSRYLRTAPAGSPVVVLIDQVECLLTRPHPADDFFRALDVADGGPAAALFGTVGSVALGADIVRVEECDSAVRRWFRGAKTVELVDFSREEIAGFVPWIEPLGADVERLLDAIASWTAGHPGLTNTLARALARGGPLLMSGIEVDTVSAQVEALFLGTNRHTEPTMADVAARFDSGPPTEMATLWTRVLAGEEPLRRSGDRAVVSLCATGLIAPSGSRLVARNRIFTTAFGAQWAEARRVGGEFMQAANAWHQAGRPSTDLLRGAALDRAVAWAQGRTDLSDALRDLIWTSVAVNPSAVTVAQAAQATAETPIDVTLPARGRTLMGFVAGLLATVCVVFLWNTNADLEHAKAALEAEKRAGRALLEAANRPPAIAGGAPGLRARGSAAAMEPYAGFDGTARTTGSTSSTLATALGARSPWDPPVRQGSSPGARGSSPVDPMASLARSGAFHGQAEASPEDAANTEVASVTRDSAPAGPGSALTRAEAGRVNAKETRRPPVRARRRAVTGPVAPELDHTEAPIVPPPGAPMIRVIKLAPGALNALDPRATTVGVGGMPNTPRTTALAPIIGQIERQAPTYRRALLRCKRLDLTETVAVRFRVDSDGRVGWAGVAAGDPERVDQPCLVRTARSFRFLPFEGQSVTATVRYRL